jgi:nicotinamide phosphoribosyltransferase
MRKNFILNTDSYKASHFLQYPPGTTHVSSYIETRGGDYEEAIFFGLQMFIKENL